MLLKTSKINKAQHEKLYKTYFKFKIIQLYNIWERELISSSRDVLYQYIKCYEKKMNEGSGLKKKGRKMVFFNDAKQLQEQLGLIKLAILVVNIPIMELNNSVDHIPMIELKKLVDDVPIIELKNMGWIF